jgi:hypothetical protein
VCEWCIRHVDALKLEREREKFEQEFDQKLEREREKELRKYKLEMSRIEDKKDDIAKQN